MAEPLIDRLYDVISPLFPAGKLIKAEEDGPRPSRPYATLRVEEVNTERHLFRSEVDVDGLVTFRENGMATVEVQVFGGNALDIANEVSRRLRAPAAHKRAHDKSLALAVIIGTQNLATLLNNAQYEPRAMLEFTVNHAQEFTEEVGRITEVEVECLDDHIHVIVAPPDA